MRSRTIPNNNDTPTTPTNKKQPYRRSNSSFGPEPNKRISYILKIFFSLIFLWTIYYIFILSKTIAITSQQQSNIDPREHFMTRRKSIDYAVERLIDKEKNEGNKNNDKSSTVAYAISLTSCSDPLLADGTAVLKHSIHLSSIRNEASKSKYDYKMYAIVHPQAASEKSCMDTLKKLGYELLIRDTPVDVTKIKGDFLREHIVKSGCCQEKELIKLWAYTLMDYPIVVHLDIDTMILQPMDELYDAMIYGPTASNMDKIKLMLPNLPIPKKIDAYFTRDYNLIHPGKKHVGMQGGFFIVRPNMTIFEEYKSIILEGNFKAFVGWGGLGYGGYYGAQQIQGLLPYFYDHLNPNTSLELNRCIYNSMVDNPYLRDTNKVETAKCKTEEETCEDCRLTKVEDIKSVHFTICQKPWGCDWIQNVKTKALCNPLHGEWFRIRSDLEDTWEKENTGFSSNRSGKMKPEHFRGFCKRSGKIGYIPVSIP